APDAGGLRAGEAGGRRVTDRHVSRQKRPGERQGSRSCIPPAQMLFAPVLPAGHPPAKSSRFRVRAVSSAGEHYVDIVGVTGSIPVPPTSFFRSMTISYRQNTVS